MGSKWRGKRNKTQNTAKSHELLSFIHQSSRPVGSIAVHRRGFPTGSKLTTADATCLEEVFFNEIHYNIIHVLLTYLFTRRWWWWWLGSSFDHNLRYLILCGLSCYVHVLLLAEWDCGVDDGMTACCTDDLTFLSVGNYGLRYRCSSCQSATLPLWVRRWSVITADIAMRSGTLFQSSHRQSEHWHQVTIDEWRCLSHHDETKRNALSSGGGIRERRRALSGGSILENMKKSGLCTVIYML